MRLLAISAAALLVAALLAGCGKKDKAGAPAGTPPATAGTAAAPPAKTKTAVVTAGPLNVRDKPGLDGKVTGRLNKGEKVVVLEKGDAAETIDGKAAYWYKVETIDKTRGWVFGGYLDAGGEAPPAPATAGTAEAAGDAPVTAIDVSAAADVPGWDAPAYYDRGKELADAGEFGEAIFYYKAATERSPQSGRYWFDFGLALQELGRHAEAATAYERAAVLLPDDFWVHNNLGLACIRARRPRRAVYALEHALKLEPGGVADPEGAKEIARRNLAAAYELDGRPEEAEALR